LWIGFAGREDKANYLATNKLTLGTVCMVASMAKEAEGSTQARERYNTVQRQAF
jgi:hypothetical protein